MLDLEQNRLGIGELLRESGLETYRELSDYTSSTRFSEDDIRGEIGKAERFIAACRPLVDQQR